MRVDCSICGREIESKTYKDGDVIHCASCISEMNLIPEGALSDIQKVKVVDFNMPFMSMLVFLVKLAIAAIPATIIITIVYSMVATFLVGITMR
jgi:hypothetical protein